jgi:hypothetical protein
VIDDCVAIVHSGFLVVKTFDALYRAFAQKAQFTSTIYALPVFGTTPDRLGVRYRGLDREALSPWQKGLLAEMRLQELRGDLIDGTEDFLATYQEALDVLGWAEEELPGVYEIVWARLRDALDVPPPGFVSLGFEPTYFTGGHFSAICDCMCFPRWHGTDPEGLLFRQYFERLNANGLFEDAGVAAEFLAYYLSFDWTETGDYEIASVWAPA